MRAIATKRDDLILEERRRQAETVAIPAPVAEAPVVEATETPAE